MRKRRADNSNRLRIDRTWARVKEVKVRVYLSRLFQLSGFNVSMLGFPDLFTTHSPLPNSTKP